MAIKKQEFYEGAALHLLARTGTIARILYDAPFFILNDQLYVLLKYSTKGRSPWGFTFTVDEQVCLRRRSLTAEIAIGLVCGADGVVALRYGAYSTVATPRNTPIHISCYRRHGEHYEVNGPDGTLGRKIAPLSWRKILEERIP